MKFSFLLLSLSVLKAVPIPTLPQLFYGGKVSALVHFNMETFISHTLCSSANWNVAQQPDTFAPTNLNLTNWVESFLALGITHAVLVAKHACGFLLWPTSTTLPDGQPYGYNVAPELDVVSPFIEECRANGIGVGFYYSTVNNFYLNVLSEAIPQNCSSSLPGQVCVSSAEYDALVLAQLTELWTQWGPLDEIWLDGGVGQNLSSSVGQLIS